MIGEFHVPDIKTTDLVKEIRRQIRSEGMIEQPMSNSLINPGESLPSSLKSFPLAVQSTIDLSGTQDLINAIKNLVEIAQSRTIRRQKWPDSLNRFPWILFKPLQILFFGLLNFIFKDQREVNNNLIASLNQLILLNQSLLDQVNILRSQSYVDLQRLSAQNSQIEQQVNNRLKYMEKQNNQIQLQLKEISDAYKEKGHQLDLTQLSLQSLETQFQKSDQRTFRDISYLKNDLTQQKKLMMLGEKWEENRENESAEASETSPTQSSPDYHALDAFYIALEDKFRGSEASVYESLQIYLPFLETTHLGTVERPILDVGCGRGEWLNLLKEHQYTATGLDLNRVMVEDCCAKGLDVKEADVVSYMKSLPEGSLGCVTGFQIIEHLPFPVLMELFQETYRVLCSGGMMIFETPNPANIEVSCWKFYLDPTHRNPLPSLFSEFLAEFTGFERVTLLDLHPDPEQIRLTGSRLANRFSDYFYGPKDYAVIGYKP
ncbi:MAG: methyltransferase domain-containing protein [Microcystaceae cyanobacterium]